MVSEPSKRKTKICRFCKETFTPLPGSHIRTYCYKPECIKIYKKYRKAYNNNSAKKSYRNTYRCNEKPYTEARIKNTYAYHKCLGYDIFGSPCKNKPRKGYFCEKCRKVRQYSNYDENDYGTCLTVVE